MRSLFVFMASSVVVLNSVSVILYFLSKTAHSVFRPTVMFINMIDTLLCVYLGIIWAADLYFQGKFLGKEEQWTSSTTCYCALQAILCFTFLTQEALLFLSVSRFFLVIHPFKITEPEGVIKFFVFLFSICFAFSFVFVFVLASTDKSAPFRLCLPFIDPDNSSTAVSIITWSAALSQIFTSTFILVLYSKHVSHLQISKGQVSNSKSTSDSYTTLFLQLFVVTFSNILCWFPSSIFYLSAMFLKQYLLLWTTVCVSPINSVVNPTVFTVTALKKLVA